MSDTDERGYDVEATEGVFQGDEYDGPPPPVDVCITNVVRTDEMPTKTYWSHVLLQTGGNAVKVLNADPKRKGSILWAIVLGGGCEAVMIGSMEDVQGNSGALMLVGTGALRYETTDQNELWAKGVVFNDTTGTFNSFGPSTDDAFLNFAVEQWTD